MKSVMSRGGNRASFNIRLTPKGWLLAGDDHRYLRAPCIGCREVVTVRTSGTYGIFGRRHVCRQDIPAPSLSRVA